MASLDTFGAKSQLSVGDASYEIYQINTVEGHDRLPYSLKILLENLLRTEDGANITADHIRALGRLGRRRRAERGDPVHPGPGADAGLHRRAMRGRSGHDARGRPRPRRRRRPRSTRSPRPNWSSTTPSSPTSSAGPDAFERNVEFEYGRNKERYQFLRWGQTAFNEFKVVPPGTGIVHQVNIEHLARVVMPRDGVAYPDTVVGTDSHTTMVNGLGVLGWGVGGIEAEAAMLGQPVSMLIPRVVGFKLNGSLPDGRHRHRPRPHHHADAAQAWCRRQVRRVLRLRRRRGSAGEPGHDRQHEPRVRLDLRHLPDRRRDRPLPAS